VGQPLVRSASYPGAVTTSRKPAPAPEPTDVLALDRQVCFALSVAARNVVAVYRPVLEPLGLTHPQYLVMLALWQYGSLSVKELSGLLQLDPGTLSPLLKRLEAAGLLRRERDARDQRNLALSLTDKGQALRAEAEKIPAGIVERLGMPVEELMRLHAALTDVIAAAQQAAGGPAARPAHDSRATDVA
jgi:MarR family transcriptional regulator, organic hydroperoxide resistance regulator